MVFKCFVQLCGVCMYLYIHFTVHRRGEGESSSRTSGEATGNTTTAKGEQETVRDHIHLADRIRGKKEEKCTSINDVMIDNNQTLSEEKAMAAAALAERERIAKELEEEKKRLEMTTTELKSGLEVKATAYANIALTVDMVTGSCSKIRTT